MSPAATIDLETRLAIEDFLYHEAEQLDDRNYEAWLALFTDDVRYTAPVRVTRKSPAVDVVDDIGHFDETIQSLGLRVRRLRTDVAWAEDPPSHTRRIVGNVRVQPTDDPDEFTVRSNLLLFRSRGDMGAHDLIAGERHDVIRRVDGEWRIASRRAVLDQSSLGTKNLGVFL
jgi:phthalate 3,4-dioxygenase subunit beta